MTAHYSDDYLKGLVHELTNLPAETEWVEFKHNNGKPDEIGEYISALANSAALQGKVHAYLVWGIDDKTHNIIGTSFRPSLTKISQEPIDNWLLRLLEPKIHFQFFEFDINDLHIVMLEIEAAFRHPIRFKDTEFFRLGPIKKKLKDFPDRERELWRILDKKPFESGIAMERITAETVLDLIDYRSYFSLLETSIPSTDTAILNALQEENLIKPSKAGHWDITCLGAILFAKKLDSFSTLKRKALRIIQYKGNNKVETIREYVVNKGYATSFEELVNQILALVPANEYIEQSLRKVTPMYPELAIRELVANALIHQDFFITGTSPMIELFDTRIEITNPGIPLVATDRFLDTPPKSRNETLASLMRRLRICEERGSGIDKVVFETELFQLPPPIFETTEDHTRTVLFAHKQFKEMDKAERIWACYLHACLRYVQRDLMTNTSLRKRFGIDPINSSMVSRIIKETIAAGRIYCYDNTVGNKAKKYCPAWAK